jgi:phage tail-like protein
MRFTITVGDAEIGRFSECSGIAAEYEVMYYPEGGQNDFVHALRGRLKYPNLVLKRGVTHEAALLKWLFEVKEWDKRGDLTVSLLGPDAQPVRHWSFAGAFPVKWQGPTLNAGSNDVASETLEICHRGLVPPRA